MRFNHIAYTIMAAIAPAFMASAMTVGNSSYTATVYDDATMDELTIEPTSYNNLSYAEYALNYTSPNNVGSTYLTGFTVDAGAGRVGNVVTSLLDNAEVQVSVKTTFMPSNYVEQVLTIVNITNWPLNNLVVYRIQDCDLFGDSANNTVGRDAATHALYQTEYGFCVAQNICLENRTFADHWQGGYPDVL